MLIFGGYSAGPRFNNMQMWPISRDTIHHLFFLRCPWWPLFMIHQKAWKKPCRDNFQAWSNLKCIFAVKTLFTLNDGWRIKRRYFFLSLLKSRRNLSGKKDWRLCSLWLREKSVTQQTLSLDRIQNRFPTDISSGLMDEFHGSELRTSSNVWP